MKKWKNSLKKDINNSFNKIGKNCNPKELNYH